MEERDSTPRRERKPYCRKKSLLERMMNLKTRLTGCDAPELSAIGKIAGDVPEETIGFKF